MKLAIGSGHVAAGANQLVEQIVSVRQDHGNRVEAWQPAKKPARKSGGPLAIRL
jgi:hypothetical protein